MKAIQKIRDTLRRPRPHRLTRRDLDHLSRAIAHAERLTSGEVRVHIEPSLAGLEPMARAQACFCELEMHQTASGTGVLLYIATQDHCAVVFTGRALLERVEPARWQEVTDLVKRGYLQQDPARGIEEAILHIGDVLREVLPDAQDAHGDELPDLVTQAPHGDDTP